MKTLNPLAENVTEAATACLLTMVQGKARALTLGHWLIASRTGLAAGGLSLVVSKLTARWRRARIGARRGSP